MNPLLEMNLQQEYLKNLFKLVTFILLYCLGELEWVEKSVVGSFVRAVWVGQTWWGTAIWGAWEAHTHRSEMLRNPPKPLTDGKQKSLIDEEGVAEAGATCGAEKLDQSNLGLRLTERMDWKLHGKNTTPNRYSCV